MGNNWEFKMGLLGGGNHILRGDGFYISYNANPQWVTGGLAFVGSMFASDDGSDETALCRNNEFLILNGDFRADYEPLVAQGYEACRAFFEEKKASHGSSWTLEQPTEALGR